MTHEDYCSYELAVALKAAGFDWACYEFWSKDFCTDGTQTKIRRTKSEPKICVMSECNSMLDKMDSDLITAPTLAVAAKWLREVKGVALNIIAHDGDEYHYSEVFLSNFQERDYKWYAYHEHPLVPTYEEALSMGISHILKLFNSNEDV